MADSNTKQTPVAVQAATILILRDTAEGMEVFMVKRHHQIDFVAGALVFPGGKVARGDADAGLAEFSDGAETWSDAMRVIGAAAIREAFEESGILFARDADTGEMVSEKRLSELDHYRGSIEKEEIGLVDVLRNERLRLSYDALTYFAHWVTPTHMPKRFDTHFFLARAPEGHAGRHDGHESVESVWIKPHEAVEERKRWNIIFPTRLNLMKLAENSRVSEAIATARHQPPVTVEPWVEEGDDGQILRIRADAGYTQTSVLMRDAV
jgi:8-oxo-dGTP pyrophosphatase MutT (NUDIX family)